MPAGNATVTVTISSEDGDLTTLEMHPSADEIGVFEADLTAARTGTYRAEVQAHVGDDSLGSDIVHFRREDGWRRIFIRSRIETCLRPWLSRPGGGIGRSTVSMRCRRRSVFLNRALLRERPWTCGICRSSFYFAWGCAAASGFVGGAGEWYEDPGCALDVVGPFARGSPAEVALCDCWRSGRRAALRKAVGGFMSITLRRPAGRPPGMTRWFML